MLAVNNFLYHTSSLGAASGCENDPENSTLLKIAACIPIIGLVIADIQCRSLKRKLKKLSLPEEFRPHPILGNILDKNATPEKRKVACQRAAQLDYIRRDYTKALLVNSLLTIAIAVCALAINLIPFIIGVVFIGGFCLSAAAFAFALYHESSHPSLYEELDQVNA